MVGNSDICDKSICLTGIIHLVHLHMLRLLVSDEDRKGLDDNAEFMEAFLKFVDCALS